MRPLDLTLPTPAENLALDEALLMEAESGNGDEVLRFWMAPEPFVVLGIGGRISREVRADACRQRGIPVFRRCSGGGTVVQGPGCLNYALVLRILPNGPLATIAGANRHIMQRHAAALSRLLRREVTVAGHTDLTLNGAKFSGNAQRRLRRHLLFHGTFLTGFDLPLITELLPAPELQPAYRQNRAHEDFLLNLQVPAGALKQQLIEAWNAHEHPAEAPFKRLHALVNQRYSRPEWNQRR